ncbi:hypothetical protein L7F22_049187 [Adiantum nelumboides]|nr:hypothetical protein [Adiantum nelumboides]
MACSPMPVPPSHIALPLAAPILAHLLADASPASSRENRATVCVPTVVPPKKKRPVVAPPKERIVAMPKKRVAARPAPPATQPRHVPPRRAPVVRRPTPLPVRSNGETLTNDFYIRSCPQVESIIRNKVTEWVKRIARYCKPLAPPLP